MKIYLTISIVISLALIVSLLVIPVVIKWVRHKGLLAQPNHRTSHVIPTPSMGGIGIFFGLLAVLPFLNYNIEIITILVSACVFLE